MANIVIHGIPEKNKLTKDLVKMLAGKLDVQLSDYEICAAYRLPTKGRIAPIIARLNTYDKKSKLLVRAKKKKLNSR